MIPTIKQLDRLLKKANKKRLDLKYLDECKKSAEHFKVHAKELEINALTESEKELIEKALDLYLTASGYFTSYDEGVELISSVNSIKNKLDLQE